ncbi:MAG: hypothetical protein AAGD00_08955 [Planctomycetota bacterium]
MPPAPTMCVLCPLEHERQALAQRLATRAPVIELRTSGTNREHVHRAVAEASSRSPALLVLAGVAGAIREVTEPVPRITSIESPHASTLRPTHAPPGVAEHGITSAGLTPDVSSKRRLAATSGATLVDYESRDFAAACIERKLNFAVVRGVSDGPNDELPPDAGLWISADGRTRLGMVVLSLIRGRATIGGLKQLQSRGNEALNAVADTLIAMYQLLRDSPDALRVEP